MTVFRPCLGKTACRDDGVKCLSCGRSLEEIFQLRSLLDQLVTLAIDNEYENTDEFANYVARKIQKQIAYRRQETQR
ncbi:MAG: hypothetical protein ACWA44_15355 [Thiotrichales bacterium]